MNGYVPSSTHFFGPVKRTALAGVVALVVLAALIPAPLDLAADRAHPPNPAKSAWFLVWIQELVSHSTLAIYVVVLAAALLVALPWFPAPRADRAAWFSNEHRGIAVGAATVACAVLALTVIGLFFRGANWTFVSPF
jgi:hypothetical protein